MAEQHICEVPLREGDWRCPWCSRLWRIRRHDDLRWSFTLLTREPAREREPVTA